MGLDTILQKIYKIQTKYEFSEMQRDIGYPLQIP